MIARRTRARPRPRPPPSPHISPAPSPFPRAPQVSPFVWQSLSAIAGNHRDRMRLFGRVCERNRILGRASTEAEIAYMAATAAI